MWQFQGYVSGFIFLKRISSGFPFVSMPFVKENFHIGCPWHSCQILVLCLCEDCILVSIPFHSCMCLFLMPVLLELCNVVWYQEVWCLWLCSFSWLLWLFGVLWCHKNFKFKKKHFCEKCHWNFDKDCIESIGGFG